MTENKLCDIHLEGGPSNRISGIPKYHAHQRDNKGRDSAGNGEASNIALATPRVHKSEKRTDRQPSKAILLCDGSDPWLP